jgi:DNA-binding GntR family transcriptional regulator
MLELEGLVMRQGNGRFRTAPIAIDDIQELAVMRISLEAMAVRLTVPTFGNADHAELEGLLAQIERLVLVEDWEGVEVPHRDFHQKLVSGAGDRIVELLGRLWDNATRYRCVSSGLVASAPENYETRSREHRAIVDAFEMGDTRAAAGWVATQIGRTALEAAALIDPDHPVSLIRATLRTHTGRETLGA